jgi:uncharacterized protein (TIGR02246 family)
MTTSTQSQLADRLAVQDVMIRYATSCDARDMAAYGSCFTEDAVISGFGGGGPIRGRQAWVDFVTNALKRFSATQHLLGNQVVEVDGDEATLQTSVQASHFLVDKPGAVMTLFATYFDKLVRKDGHWQIYDHRLQPIGTQVLGGDQ